MTGRRLTAWSRRDFLNHGYTGIMIIMIMYMLTPGDLRAQRSGDVCAQESVILERFVQKTSGISSMTCDFVQTKHISLLAEELKSSGSMTFRKPGQLRWEYTEPYIYRFIFNGERVFIGNDDRNNVIEARKNSIFGTIARVMMNTVSGRIGELKNDFDISLEGPATAHSINLIPKKREMKRLLSKVELTVDEKAGTITHIRLTEKNGDTTDITLSDIKLNTPVDETPFIIP